LEISESKPRPNPPFAFAILFSLSDGLIVEMTYSIGYCRFTTI